MFRSAGAGGARNVAARPNQDNSSQAEASTVADLRKELEAFAQEALRRELNVMKESLLRELEKRNQPAPQEPRAVDGSAEGCEPTSRSACSGGAPTQDDGSEKQSTSVPREPGGQEIAIATSDPTEAQQPLIQSAGCEDVAVEQVKKRAPKNYDEDKFRPSGPISEFIHDLIFSEPFDLAIVVIVFANIIAIAAQTDYDARYWTQQTTPLLETLEVAFCAIYTIELTMRLHVFGLGFFCGEYGTASNWNDFILVFLQLLERFALILNGGHDYGKRQQMARHTMAFIRCLRIARVARISRILHLVPDFRMLLVSIFFSLKSLMWVLLLIAMSTLIFGIFLTQVVTIHKTELGREEMEEMEKEKLEEYFGTLFSSMLVLYEIISDGIHWAEVAEPLIEYISPWLQLVFIIYTLISLFAMMNVLTAFFVETAIKAGVEDKQTNLLKDMWELFEDRDNRSKEKTITENEFINRIKEAEGEKTEGSEKAPAQGVQALLKELDLSPEDVAHSNFFRLIDKDHSGSVDMEELTAGCVRLTRAAKVVDIAGLTLDLQKEAEENSKHRQHVQEALDRILRSCRG